MKLTGAQALIKSLELEGTEVMFGLPGGAILPAYDPIIDSPIRHILVRHEQGAGHMAEGYAHVTGQPGVAMVTSGPAATNIVTPLCDAYMDSIPIVVITGQVSRSMIGTDGFQECDTVGITRSVTKHNDLVMDAQDIPLAVREAFHIAKTGRPGPVLVDVPKDVLQATMDWSWPSDGDVAASLPGYRPTTKGHAADGAGRLSRRPSAVPRHARDARQLHRYHRHAACRPADRAWQPLRRPGDRTAVHLRS
jgi:acetolactate synthase-1/2/3 large subunit